MLEQKLDWQDGYIIPPTGPGLGIALNKDVVAAHSPYRGTRLHLSMADLPHDFRAQSDASWKDPARK